MSYTGEWCPQGVAIHTDSQRGHKGLPLLILFTSFSIVSGMNRIGHNIDYIIPQALNKNGGVKLPGM